MIRNIKNKIILPLAKPWITTYPLFANPLSIIQLYEETHPWILSSFLQLICNGNEALSFYDFNYRTCPYLTVQRIHKDLLCKSDINLINFLKYIIHEHQYVYLIVNTKYISVYNRENNHKHDMFIYGYDDSKQIFYMADNFINGKYSYGECKYTELIASINNLSEKDEGYLGLNGCIEFMSYNADNFYNKFYSDINLKRIKDSLNSYLDGKPLDMWSLQDFRVAKYGEKNFSFGINCYKFLHENINYLVPKSKHNLHFPSFFAMYDHKMHLFRIVQYLHNIKFIYNGEKHMNDLNELCKLAKINLNLIIKYIFSTKYLIMREKVHSVYNKLEEVEKKVIQEVINDFKIS